VAKQNNLDKKFVYNIKIINVKYILYFLCTICFTACNIDTDKPTPQEYNYQVKINFIPMVGTLPFSLNTPFNTGLGELFTATKLKWYTSNWAAKQNANNLQTAQQYFLADASNNSFSTTIKLDAANVNNLSFMLGVDSLKNVSGAQEGALDPLNAMFWTWNSGYIMFKLEGTSPQSTLVNNKLEYHVGGFKGATSALRNINFNLPTPLVINKNKASEIDVEVNLLKLFNGTHNVSIAANASCHSPNAFSVKLADNYSQMFTIKAIRNF
jgi:hypothetical protein